MALETEDLERQLELLAMAIYDSSPNSLHNWAHDYLSLLRSHREQSQTQAPFSGETEKADEGEGTRLPRVTIKPLLDEEGEIVKGTVSIKEPRLFRPRFAEPSPLGRGEEVSKEGE